MEERRSDPAPIGGETARAVVAVDRAVGDLRRGGIVVLGDDAGGASAVLAAEYATGARLERLEALPGRRVSLVVTAPRARALGRGAAGGPVVALPLAAPLDPARIHDLSFAAAPGEDVLREARGLRAAVAHARDAGAVALARLAGLLPAVLARTLDTANSTADAWARAHDLMPAALADIERYRGGAAALRRVGSARVPLAGAEDTTVTAFRPGDGGAEYLAIVIGEPDGAAPVLTRLHSQCFTGDLIGSLRCDCGDQLRGAIRRIAEAGAGVILYLPQEGRGIGLVNKLRAYTLQDRGHDTFDANEMLGFDADERHYRAAAEMLRQLGYARVRLLTNNPDKVAALRGGGIDVAERVPHGFPANRHNERYLAAKATRGHLING